MAAEQNHSPETQHLLSGSSLNIVSNKQMPTAWLAMFQQAFFSRVYQQNSGKTFFSFVQYLTPGEVGLPLPCVLRVHEMWRSLAQDMAAWAKTCLHCQQSKIHHHIRTRPLHSPVYHCNID
jgi:hypothetical protein